MVATLRSGLADKARDAIQRQQDPSAEGRPVSLMLGGGLLAIVAAVLCGLLARDIWLTGSVEQTPGIYGISALYGLFAGGVVVFCLGLEFEDAGKALRLAFLIALLGVAALALIAGMFAVLLWLKSGAGAAAAEGPAGKVLGLVPGAGGKEERAEPRHTLAYSLLCRNCNRDFIPVPPDAICPWCDTPYFTMPAGTAAS